MTVQPATLREQLEENYDKIITPADTTSTLADDTTSAAPAAAVDTAATTSEVEKPDTTAGERVRDPETGRFVETKDDKKADPVKQTDKPATIKATVTTVEEKLGVKRPDSWKKDLWTLWDKLDAGQPLSREERKQYLEYINEREGQYTKGVSAYKAEADHAKALRAAIAPYEQMMASQGITPDKFIATLANVHQTLSSGAPQDKLRAFARFAQDYQIPLHELLVQGEDGKVYLNQQYFQTQQDAAQSGQVSPQDIDKLVDRKMQQMMLARVVQEFEQAKDAGGNLLHPHFQVLRQTMDGLLRSGVVRDLQSAHDMALKAPQHAELYVSVQEQDRKTKDEAKQREEAEKAARAKANAVSPKTSTPTGKVGDTGKKGLRAALEDSYETHVAGRI